MSGSSCWSSAHTHVCWFSGISHMVRVDMHFISKLSFLLRIYHTSKLKQRIRVAVLAVRSVSMHVPCYHRMLKLKRRERIQVRGGNRTRAHGVSSADCLSIQALPIPFAPPLLQSRLPPCCRRCFPDGTRCRPGRREVERASGRRRRRHHQHHRVLVCHQYRHHSRFQRERRRRRRRRHSLRVLLGNRRRHRLLQNGRPYLVGVVRFIPLKKTNAQIPGEVLLISYNHHHLLHRNKIFILLDLLRTLHQSLRHRHHWHKDN
uniref:Uncharacterized protein n=1 Tax=Setaria viridis TaxID=4556 RepID=A0A4U6VWR4_SETVI|nr:hypothetical protein SEVIR_2G307100v2 [Setaria viridis]